MSDAFQKYTPLTFTMVLLTMLLSAAVPKQQTNQITIRGKVNNISEVKAMVHYYSDYWQLEHLHLFIEFTPQLPTHYQGYTRYVENKALKTKQVMIRISDKISEKEQWLTLAHEMIHVKQFSRGELIYHGGTAYTWKRHYYKDVTKITYKQRGWEKEAFGLEKKMLRQYQQAHKLIAQK